MRTRGNDVEQALAVAHRVSDILARHTGIDNFVLGGEFGLLEKVIFGSYRDCLQALITELSDSLAAVKRIEAVGVLDQFLAAINEYISRLTMTVASLTDICDRFARKASGLGRLGWFAYRRSLKAHTASEQRYL